jgi:hypothetical protein
MFQAYANQTDIPEALREHYSKREDGKWHADIADDHPAVKHNAKLLSEKQGAESKVTQLTSDLESARAGNLGRGQVAVTKAEVQLLDEYRALGKTPAELTTTVTEHKTLKETEAKRAEDDKRVAVATELGYNPEAFKRLSNLPDFDIRTDKDGKKVFALVKDGDKVVEKPATEYLESNADIAPFLPALKAKPSAVGVTVNGTSSSVASPSSTDPFAWAKQYADNYIKTAKPSTDWTAAYGADKPTL